MQRSKIARKLIVTIFLLALVLIQLQAANRYSVATGNWNATSTWSATSGGTPGASVPVAGDVVYIEGNRTVTVNANSACATINIASGSTLSVGAFNLTVSSATNVSGTILFTSTTGTKTMGAVTVSGGTWTSNAAATYVISSLTLTGSTFGGSATGIFNVSGAMSVSGGTNTFAASTITVTGSSTVNGIIVFTSTTGTKTFNGGISINGGTWTSNAGETYTATSLSLTGATLNGSNTGIFTVSGNLIVGSGTTTVNPATLNINGTTTIDGTFTIASTTGTKTFTGLITINSGGHWNNTVNEAYILRGGIVNNGTFTSGTATYTLNTNSQTISGSQPITFGGTLAITGVITVTNQTNVTINGSLTGSVAGSTWVNAENSTLNARGALLTRAGTILDASAYGNSVNYFMAGNQTIKGGTAYHNLYLAGTGTKTQPTTALNVAGDFITTTTGTLTTTTRASLTIGGNLDIGAGTTFTAAGFDLTINGATTVSGIHAHSSTTGTKTHNGDVTINPGGSWTNAGNEGFTFNGNLINNGSLTDGTGTYIFAGSSKILGGSNDLTIRSATINGSYTNQTTLTVNTALSGTGSLTQANNATLNIGNTSGLAILNASATGNTVNYTRAGDQTIKNNNYFHLNLSGSGIKTLPNSAITVAGNFSTSGTVTATANAGYAFGGNITLGAGTTFNAGVHSHSIAGDWLNNSATFNPSSGTFTFNGSSSQNIGGTANTTFNCITINNAAGVILGRAVNAACVTLQNGLLTTTSTNLLTVTGTSSGAITGSASSYVNGPLARNLPSVSGGNYTFPIGKSGYNPLELININTPGTATIRAEVFDASCGGTPGVGLSSLNTNRYWNASITLGSITNTRVRLTETGLGTEDAIGQSASQTGDYDRVSDDPPSGNTLITWATPLTSLGFFAIGEKPIVSIAATTNGTEGGSNGLFTLTTSKNFTVTRYINISISGTATNGTDYTTITSPITFPAGQSTATIPVNVIDDLSVETTQTVTITIETGAGYAVGTQSSATIDIYDNDVAGITVSPTSGLVTTEAGGQATFTIVLNTQPSANVSVGISSNTPAEGTVSPTSVTFTSGNWSTPQTITITGVNDNIDDDDQPYTIITAPATSGDPNYNGNNPSDVSVTNLDDDTAGITVNPTSGLTVTEATGAGNTATFTIVLNTRPTADVTIAFLSDDTSEGTVSPASVTFTPANWSTARTITVTGVDDFIIDGNVLFNISGTPSGSDLKYAALAPTNVSVTNIDNDVAGFVINPLSGLQTSEALTTATFTIKLTAQPSSDVEVSFVSSDPSEGTVSPASFIFTPTNWNTNQTITLTGVDGPDKDGDQPYYITVSVSSTLDVNYQSVAPVNVSAINIDDDVPGFTVNPTSLTTNEWGTLASFSITPNTRPQEDVIISVSSYDATEGSLSSTTLTFTYDNWSTTQSITVTGVNDDVDDGDVTYSIVFAPTSSSDPDYDNKTITSISATNIDDDTAGITVGSTSGLETTEAGGQASFTIKLNSEPTADVTIGLSSSNTTEGTVSPASVTFTSGNWNTEQIITVTGVDDDIDDDDADYTIDTAPATSSDPKYSGMNASDVSITNIDDDVAGFTFSATSGLTTTEAGGQATFTIRLNTQPVANVIIDLSSSTPSEGTASPASLTFNAGNWSTPQTVTIIGQNDDVMDGNQVYTIITTMEPTADAKYNALNPPDVSVTNLDDDVAGFTVNPTSGLVTTEAGGQATFTVKLNSQPTTNVVIGISSSTPSEGTVSPATLTFTPGNWNTNQTVTITGVNDFIQDGNIAYTITIAPANSGDPNYHTLDPPDVSVTNNDNDVAGINVSPTSGLTTSEDGGTAEFTVILTSQPTHDVTVGLSSSNPSEGTVSPSSLVFIPSEWNMAKTVTITGIDDNVIDGSFSYVIYTAPATSSDPNYNNRNADDVSVSNTDNDVAAIIVEPTEGLETTESGGQATFTIKFASIPTADVTIGLSSNIPTEGTVSPATLVITPANWNANNTVTVTGVNDEVDDDNVEYTIVTNPASSSDIHYNGINPANVTVTNINDDDAGITIDPTSGHITSENGTTSTFTIRLDTKPTANVIVTFTFNTNEATLSQNSVTFTTLNWNSPVSITITGKNDNDVDGDVDYSITSAASSTDLKYNGMTGDDISVTNLDNDTPGITASPSSGLVTTEAGGQATFTVVLDTRPSGNNTVTIDLTSSLTTEGTVSPSQLTFNKDNWSSAQTVTITGVNDALVDGNILYFIQFDVTSGDNNYNNINVNDVSVTNTDLTPTITLSTNPTVCRGTTTANLAYTATTKTPNQYTIDFDAAAEAQGFVDVAYTALPANPIALTVPAGAAAGTYNATIRVRNSTYPACVSPIYSISVSVNSVTAGTIGSDQTFYGVANPAELTQTSAATGTGTLSYRWESSTTNCSVGFAAIGGATSTTYDPPSGLTETTFYRRVAISTLNGVPCEATSNCVTVTVNSVVITVSPISASECPELDPAKGFQPNNNGPYNPGATDIVFELSCSTPAKEWQYTFDVSEAENITGFTVQSVNTSGTGYSPSAINASSGTFMAIPSSTTTITVTIRVSNIPGSQQDVKFNVSNVKYTDDSFSDDYTDKIESILIKAMPAIGDFN